MLLTLMMNLNMFGQPVPPKPKDQGGFIYPKEEGGDSEDDRRRMLQKEDEELMMLLSQWIIKNN